MRSFWCVVVLLAFAVSTQAQSVTVVEIPITTNSAQQYDAAIADKATVFTDERLGDLDLYWDNGNGGVYPLRTGIGSQHDADADGNLVVFTRDDYGNDNIQLLDLDTGSGYPVTTNSALDNKPVISGDNIVFVTDRLGNTDLYWYNIPSAKLLPLVTTAWDEGDPVIDGTLVAWNMATGGNYDVYAMELGGTPFLVAGGSASERFPSVSGHLISYVSLGNVFIYDHSTGQTAQITDNPYIQNNVLLDGRRVYWQDDSNGNQDIFVHDLDAGATFQLTSDASDQVLTDAEGNRVVYHDYRYGNYNVWSLTYEINSLPIAAAGADQDVYLGDTVQLQGTASDPDDDPITTWQWTIDSAPDGSTATLSDNSLAGPTFAPDQPGAYVLSLMAFDGLDWSLPSTLTITANENLPPISIVTATPASGTAPLEVSLDATGCSDPEGGALTYAWNLGDGNNAGNVDSLVHIYQSAGAYEAILTVTDDNGQQVSDNVLIVVDPLTNNPPTSSPTATPNNGLAPLTVQFAAGANDQDNDPLSYLWDFGDGGDSSLENPQHTFITQGVYTVSLIVSDGKDNTSSSLNINVNATTGLIIDKAIVQWKPKKASFGRVRLEGTFAGGTMTKDTEVQLTFDGIKLFTAPVTAFVFDGNSKYTYRDADTSVTMDVKSGELKVFRRNTTLIGLENANGVDVVLSFGKEALAQNIVMTPAPGRKLTYSGTP